jgi:hypothetical protein
MKINNERRIYQNGNKKESLARIFSANIEQD